MHQTQKIAWLSLCLLISISLQAQQYLFDAKLLTTEDGLASLATTAIYKDNKGFIWIGTNQGLNRYDGYVFEQYTKANHHLAYDDYIRHLSEDNTGNIWLYYYEKTDNKSSLDALDIFNPIQQKAISFDEYFKNKAPFEQKEITNATIVDNNNRIWLPTVDGTLWLYEKGEFNKIFQFKTKKKISHITVDNKDNIWLSRGSDLTCINPKGVVLDQEQLPNNISDIWIGKGNKVWLTTIYSTQKSKSGFRKIHWEKISGQKASPINLNKKLQNLPVQINIEKELDGFSVYRDSEGYWYISLRTKGLHLLDSEGNWLFNYSNLLPRDAWISPNATIEDGNDLWVARGGLLKLSKQKNPFQLIHKQQALSDCRGITGDDKGNIYFANAKLYQWKLGQEYVQKIPKSDIVGSTGVLFYEAKSHSLWSSYYSPYNLGYQYNLNTNAITPYQSLSEKATFAFSILPSPVDSLHLVGQDVGLTYLNFDSKKLYPFKGYNGFDELATARINYLHQSTNGIWIATDKGIYWMQNGKIIQRFHQGSKDLPFDHIRHIHEDNTGIFWLASKGGGIIRWQPPKNYQSSPTYQQFTKQDGLSHNNIYAIYEASNKLWITSDRGLMCMNKNTFQVKTYLTEHGLSHNEFNFPSHYQAKDGRLYFGGLGGLITFHPNDFKDNFTTNTPLVITRYQLLEAEKEELTDYTHHLPTSNIINIHPSDKLIELQLSLLDYDDTDQHQYAYQIEGYSDKWTLTEGNLIRITSLPYGNYTLKIKGKNKAEGWSTQELTLTVHVLSPFYLQWWFFIVAFLTLSSSIWIFIKTREQRLQKDKARLEQEVQLRTQKIEADKQIILQQTQQLQSLDEAKTRFFTNITHEFRTPLTLILGPVEQVIKEGILPKNRSRMQMVQRNAKHLLGLINQLLDISKLESGEMKVEVTQGDIVAFTQEFVTAFDAVAQKKSISIRYQSEGTAWATYFDKDKWQKIIFNLLSNAIKFTPKGGRITVTLRQLQKPKNTIQLTVADTGIGIEAAQLATIFDRFQQIDNSMTRSQEGTGIGLALVKELVEVQGGHINVKSQVQRGTTFTVQIPVLKPTITTNVDIPIASIPIAKLPTIPVQSPIISTDIIQIDKENPKLTLLIIEDNAEMRTYIKDCIDTNIYHIIEAEDGVVGIQKATSLVPDLIVSDVMMPNKNGFEVVETIRNTVSTSHIPVILLTAKTALKSRLKGFERGADAYLTKPFSPAELAIRIQKLIEIRQLIQQHFQDRYVPKTKQLGIEKENTFIDQVRNIILKDLTQENLNGDYIGHQIGLSRMQLHRKLKALTNQTTSQYIRITRLEQAHQRLQRKTGNISEIAYQTGFSSIGSFSKAFKQHFGKKPSDLLREQQR